MTITVPRKPAEQRQKATILANISWGNYKQNHG